MYHTNSVTPFSEHFSVSEQSLILFSKIFKFKLVFWSHGYNRKKGFDPKRSVPDKLRVYCLRSSDAVILYGENDKKLLSNYIDKNKIFVAYNTFINFSVSKVL